MGHKLQVSETRSLDQEVRGHKPGYVGEAARELQCDCGELRQGMRQKILRPGGNLVGHHNFE